jgi:hypothetical protein
VRPGAERAPGLDDDRRRDVLRRRLPRWPDPDACYPSALVELAPAILPPRLDHRCLDAAEGAAEEALSLRVRVGGKLDLAADLAFLESLRSEREELRAGDLRLSSKDADRDAEQPLYRRALFRRLKNPSSSSPPPS